MIADLKKKAVLSGWQIIHLGWAHRYQIGKLKYWIILANVALAAQWRCRPPPNEQLPDGQRAPVSSLSARTPHAGAPAGSGAKSTAKGFQEEDLLMVCQCVVRVGEILEQEGSD